MSDVADGKATSFDVLSSCDTSSGAKHIVSESINLEIEFPKFSLIAASIDFICSFDDAEASVAVGSVCAESGMDVGAGADACATGADADTAAIDTGTADVDAGAADVDAGAADVNAGDAAIDAGATGADIDVRFPRADEAAAGDVTFACFSNNSLVTAEDAGLSDGH